MITQHAKYCSPISRGGLAVAFATLLMLAVFAGSGLAAGLDITELLAGRGMSPACHPKEMAYVFSGGGHSAKFMPGSSQVLLDGRFVELSGPVRLFDSALVAPRDIKLYLPAERPTPLPGKAQSPRMTRVMIDAGHGGHDPGAVANGLKEKDIVLDVALRLGRSLKRKGWTVAYTRSDDTFVPLDDRADLANRFKADVFVSVHANAAGSSAANGFETYIVDNKVSNVVRGEESARKYDLRPEATGMSEPPSPELEAVLWGLLFEEYKLESRRMASAIQSSIEKAAPTANRGVKLGPWRVIRKANCVHCLIEIGFMTNRAEAARLAKPSYRSRIASAIAEGVGHIKKSFDQTRGFSQ